MRRILLLLLLLLLVWLGIKAWRRFHPPPHTTIKSITDVIAAVTRDRALLGKQLLAGQLAPDDYLARVRDRNRKLHNAQTDPSWLNGLIKGERDGDLVPDNIDNCPDTSALAATDDPGCPQSGTFATGSIATGHRTSKERDACCYQSTLQGCAAAFFFYTFDGRTRSERSR